MKVLQWLRSHITQEGPADVSPLDRADRPHRAAAMPSSLAAPSRTVPMTDGRHSLDELAADAGAPLDRRAPIFTGAAIESAVRTAMREHGPSSQAGLASIPRPAQPARLTVEEMVEVVRFAMAGCPFDPETDEIEVTDSGAIVHVHPLGGAR
ncbi:hypothetical protein ACFT5B_11815 [Luteimicrobium sp. NPDC057192]|uniref:hypothetical protein n=1 Tax=Luteimicrobium sp. NPDC057192 TaxID=3346042 RepID=UPI00363048A0